MKVAKKVFGSPEIHLCEKFTPSLKSPGQMLWQILLQKVEILTLYLFCLPLRAPDQQSNSFCLQ